MSLNEATPCGISPGYFSVIPGCGRKSGTPISRLKIPTLYIPATNITWSISMAYPRLMVNRSRDLKLSPEIQFLDHAEAISALPLDIIDNFLSKNRVTDDATLRAAPYVLGGNERRILMGMEDDFYARGDFHDNQFNYGIYRRGDPYLDPETGEVTGDSSSRCGCCQSQSA